jgi:hypothetical protein
VDKTKWPWKAQPNQQWNRIYLRWTSSKLPIQYHFPNDRTNVSVLLVTLVELDQGLYIQDNQIMHLYLFLYSRAGTRCCEEDKCRPLWSSVYHHSSRQSSFHCCHRKKRQPKESIPYRELKKSYRTGDVFFEVRWCDPIDVEPSKLDYDLSCKWKQENYSDSQQNWFNSKKSCTSKCLKYLRIGSKPLWLQGLKCKK